MSFFDISFSFIETERSFPINNLTPSTIGSHWKDLPSAASSIPRTNPAAAGGGPPGMPGQARMKPETGAGGVWSHGRNGSWDEIGAGPGGVAWEDAAGWAKQKMAAAGGGMWGGADELDWHKASTKPQLTKEMVWNSKQFRMLVDMGHKVKFFLNIYSIGPNGWNF